MPRIFLYAHGGSGNHGCEAIVRSTAELLSDYEITLISSRPEEDRQYGLDQICRIVKDRSDVLRKCTPDFLFAYIALKLHGDYVPMDKLWYADAFSDIQEGDIALSIGGDNYCYADVSKYIMLHDMLKKRGVKTILWGCSVEPAVAARPEVSRDLARYDLIVARESITYNCLKQINPNTILAADPAFALIPKKVSLPKGFVPGNTLGLNISPMAMALESQPGLALENYKNLISYVIDNTTMQIVLTPHVIWADGDDRIPLQQLFNMFSHTGRVSMIPDCSCQELKYLISQCRFFIGARTHSTIAAYSSGVPTLVLGYSVKSRGIARDLFGTEQGFVLPVQDIDSPDELTNAFLHLQSNEQKILSILNRQLPLLHQSHHALQKAFPSLQLP